MVSRPGVLKAGRPAFVIQALELDWSLATGAWDFLLTGHW
jgi:hypothetical protein